jgi:hypothetical protein
VEAIFYLCFSRSLSLLLHASVVGRGSQLPPSHWICRFGWASAQLQFACTTFRTAVNIGVSWLLRESKKVLLVMWFKIGNWPRQWQLRRVFLRLCSRIVYEQKIQRYIVLLFTFYVQTVVHRCSSWDIKFETVSLWIRLSWTSIVCSVYCILFKPKHCMCEWYRLSLHIRINRNLWQCCDCASNTVSSKCTVENPAFGRAIIM